MKNLSVLPLVLCSALTAFAGPPPEAANGNFAGNVVRAVKHLTRVKILESNNVGLRPGSVYDNSTYFESLAEFPRPGFNYEFLDSGLGAAEPLYPMYQKGHQGSYLQLGKAFFSEQNRHIDHYSTMETPEGCRVDGIYLLRDITEYPKKQYRLERAEGYKLIVVRLEYYTKLRPDAQCGRHRANDPDPSFDPVAYMNSHADSMNMSDFPAKDLPRFEAKVSAIYHVRETMSPKWPRFDMNNMNRNSLWYYPEGHAPDYGINTPRPQPGLHSFNAPKHMLIEASAPIQQEFNLSQMLKPVEFQKFLNFIDGHPTPDFDPMKEPGRDTLRLSDVTPNHLYTSGLHLENIRNVVDDVSNAQNYRLVGMTIKPYEEQEDQAWQGLRVIPQIRFVYQLMNPRNPEQPFEQLFLHLKWDVVDRFANVEIRKAQHLEFLKRVDELTAARETKINADQELEKFIRDFTNQRPVETVAFSSSLTGIWVFGALTREVSASQELLPQRIKRAGLDVGYYSSTYDNDLFRAAIKVATGAHKAELEKVLSDINVSFFRDSKRQDVHAIDFNTVTCAQCHQTSGRDGIHMAFNDEIDRRITSKVNMTEFFFRDADAQLKKAVKFWLEPQAANSDGN